MFLMHVVKHDKKIETLKTEIQVLKKVVVKENRDDKNSK